MMNKLIRGIATVFGIGYIPYAQGTLASLVGLGLYLLIYHCREWLDMSYGSWQLFYMSITGFVIITGFLVSGRAERIFGKKDSQHIVIDEVSGMLLALLFIPFNVFYIGAGFALYRLFDIIKIYPLNRLERLPAGWGIMLDDLAAGLYVTIILQVITRMLIC